MLQKFAANNLPGAPWAPLLGCCLCCCCERMNEPIPRCIALGRLLSAIARPRFAQGCLAALGNCMFAVWLVGVDLFIRHVSHCAPPILIIFASRSWFAHLRKTIIFADQKRKYGIPFSLTSVPPGVQAPLPEPSYDTPLLPALSPHSPLYFQVYKHHFHSPVHAPQCPLSQGPPASSPIKSVSPCRLQVYKHFHSPVHAPQCPLSQGP